MRRWALNASPIIALSRLGRLDLFDLLFPGFVIPNAVIGEVCAGPDDSANAWIKQVASSHVVEVSRINELVATWDLGKGESEVLTWAHENSDGAVLDDLAARKTAKVLGVPVQGTLAVLVSAKRRGFVQELTPMLEILQEAGFHISPSLAAKAKMLAGE